MSDGPPLAGKAILVTRALEQAGELITLLEEAGAEAVAMPTVAFFPPVDPKPLDVALATIERFSWIAFTSANAVHAFFERVPAPAAESLRGIRMAAVGPKTAEAIEQWGLEASLVSTKQNAASLAEALSRVCRPGERVFYPRAERASEDLADILMSRGIEADEAIAYRSAPPAADAFSVASRMRAGTIDWVTIFSGSALRHLLAVLPEARRCLGQSRLATIGPKTTAEAEALGFVVNAEAAEPSAAAMVAAILAAEGHT